MKYVPAYERYLDEEDKSKPLVYHYKDGVVTTKGEPTDADHPIDHMAFLTVVPTLIFKLIPNAESIELTYIPTAHELIVKFNVEEEERDFVVKTVSNGFLLYSRAEIPATDVLTRVEDEPSEIEFYEDYPYTYDIPVEHSTFAQLVSNHPELKDDINYPCLLIKQGDE